MPEFRFPPVDPMVSREIARDLLVMASDVCPGPGEMGSFKQLATANFLHVRALAERFTDFAARAARREEALHRARLGAVRGIVSEAVSDGFDPGGLFVYILWGDDAERPVYVGQSANVLARVGSHMADPRKRELVRRVQLIRCTSVTHMCRLEGDLIEEYQPLLNRASGLYRKKKVRADA